MLDSFLEAHRIDAGTFSIAGRLHPISIRDQILRSHEFVRRAFEAGLIVPGALDDATAPKFLVVGAGVAGVTAALEAALLGVPTILIEQEDVPFFTQAFCSTRFLHPNQYDWPLSHWTEQSFQWHRDLIDSELPWYFGDYPDVLATAWETTLENLRTGRLSTNLEFHKRERLSDLALVAPHVVEATTINRDSGASDKVVASAVLIATGFGKERCSLGTQYHPQAPAEHWFQSRGFWATDDLQTADFGIGISQPRVLISGGGDGALQDLLRVLVNPKFPSAHAVLQRLPDTPGLFKRIQDAHDCAERKYQWDGQAKFNHAVLRFLQDRFDEAVDDVLSYHRNSPDFESAMREIVRDPLPEIYLVWTCDHFARSYPLNRFLVTLLAKYVDRLKISRAGSLPLLNPGRRVYDIRRSAAGPCEYEFDVWTTKNCYEDVPIAFEKTEFADIVIIRHGPSFDHVPDHLKHLVCPPRTQQLLPYGFVAW